MTPQVITADEVRSLLGQIMEQRKVVAPHERPGDDQHAFEELDDPEDAVLMYTTTALPPKRFAFPAEEPLVEYDLGDEPQAEPVIETEPITLFGVHPCDIFSMNALDKAFADVHPEANYLQKRKEMQIIGIECVPDEFCFCASMGSATVDEGYDLFLTPLDECQQEFLVEVGTDAGAEMLQNISTRDATAGEIASLKALLEEKVEGQRSINCDVANLPLLFSNFEDSDVWHDWAEKCYSCGTCNLVCPACFCFDVIDDMALSLDSGQRIRKWDGCMLEGFAEVAGGENFREERWQRLRHRFFRKYSYLFTKYGVPFCCGCGRCGRQCLVDINPIDVLNDLIEEHSKEAVTYGQ